MRVDFNDHLASILDYARQFADMQVETLAAELRWKDEEYPAINNAMADMDGLEERTGDELAIQWRTAATLYAYALAKEAYLRGVKDGGRIYNAFISGELPGKE